MARVLAIVQKCIKTDTFRAQAGRGVDGARRCCASMARRACVGAFKAEGGLREGGARVSAATLPMSLTLIRKTMISIQNQWSREGAKKPPRGRPVKALKGGHTTGQRGSELVASLSEYGRKLTISSPTISLTPRSASCNGSSSLATKTRAAFSTSPKPAVF